jgi:hypothetical protein
MAAGLLEEVALPRSLGGLLAGLYFRQRPTPSRPRGREVFQQGLIGAETHANLPKLDGGAWHALKRKWASERNHLPLVDVAGAGGGKDTQTLINCISMWIST